MSGTLLVPLQVEARVVTAPTTAPAWKSAADIPLAKGVHLHFALPDALVAARSIDAPGGPAGKKVMLFPAVPDLWLVVRFNPVGSGPVRVIKMEEATVDHLSRPVASGRGARAWVIETRTRQSVDLASWTPPAYDTGSVQTLAGILPAADSLGWAGWGVLPDDATDIGEGVAAYYPECQNQFGLHDPLDDLGSATGQVSYQVIGWYASSINDPIAQATDVQTLLAEWQLSAPDSSNAAIYELPTEVAVASGISDYLPVIKSELALAQPAAATGAAVVAPRPAVVNVNELKSVAHSLTVDRVTLLQSGMAALIKDAGAVADGLIAQAQPVVRGGPDSLACHGAALDVSLAGGAVAVPASPNVVVLPSLQEALAEVAALGNPSMSADDKLALTAMLLDADKNLRALPVPAAANPKSKQQAAPALPDPALLALANDVQALGFQGAPGESTWFAELLLDDLIVQWRPGLGANTKVMNASLAQSALLTENATPAGAASGHWPRALINPTLAADAQLRSGTTTTSQPTAPTDAQVSAFIATITQAITAINQPSSGAAVHTVHPTFLRVVDSRSGQAGKTNTPGTPLGPTGSSYWVDLGDPAASRNLYIAAQTASVTLPSPTQLYEQPGARWYRPYSPHVVIAGAGRAYRYGFDGRFDPDGLLQCRLPRDTLTSLNVAPAGVPSSAQPTAAVAGSQILGSAATAIAAHAGLPALVLGLLQEVVLLDPDSAADLASQWLHHFQFSNPKLTAPASADVQKAFQDQIVANWALRDTTGTASYRQTLVAALDYLGVMPSPIAFVPWLKQPWAPLFANVQYQLDSRQPGALGTVELPAGTTPTAIGIVKGSERRLLTPSVSKILESVMLTRTVLNPQGKLIRANGINQPGDPDRFLKMDVLTTALTSFDDTCAAAGLAERAGAITVQSIQVVDAFGSAQTYSGAWSTSVPTRFPEWSRLQLQLMSGTDAAATDDLADLTHSPVCGYLVTDLLAHALAVYDGDGNPLGELVSDPPIEMTSGIPSNTPIPAVRFQAHPTLAFTTDPIEVVANPWLKQFVDGVRSSALGEASVSIPAGQVSLRESALTALLRVIDTVRPTIDPTDVHSDHKVRILGAPLALVRSRLSLQRTTGSTPAAPPTLLTDPVNLTVKVGAVLQPDDGLIGCFQPASAAGAPDAQFAPVDAAAVNSALLNGLADAVAQVTNHVIANNFVRPASGDTTYTVSGAATRDLLLLLDIKGGVYLTSGALPRGKQSLSREALSGALQGFAPTIRVGPVLALPDANGQSNPFLPAPAVAGRSPLWLEAGQPPTNLPTSEPLPALPPDGLLPAARCTVTEGWIELSPDGPG